jgi:hypothetical protein
MERRADIPNLRRARDAICVVLLFAAMAGISFGFGVDRLVVTQSEFDALNSADLEPGDRILLAGGTTFTGKLVLGPEDSGTDAQGNLINPVVVTSFGSGRATIAGGDGGAILAYNCGGIEIGRLTLTGSGVAADGSTTNTASGITVYADVPGDL